jgi:epoxide hydrolase-like predicted phosphatase
MSTINALITDFGGVLTTSIFESFNQFAIDHGLEPEILKTVFAETIAMGPTNILYRMETGELSQEEFESLFAAELSKRSGTQIEALELKARMFSQVRPDPEMVNAIIAIRKAGFPTALLSNSWGPGGYPRETFGDLFDAVVISGEVGLRKPDPEIYRMAAKLIEVEPTSCVFIDDIKGNVEGAEAVGMTGIHHRDAELTVKKLEEMFEMSLQQPS